METGDSMPSVSHKNVTGYMQILEENHLKELEQYPQYVSTDGQLSFKSELNTTGGIYIGKLKKGKPEGFGIIYVRKEIGNNRKYISLDEVTNKEQGLPDEYTDLYDELYSMHESVETYLPYYIGNFKNGKADGYGILLSYFDDFGDAYYYVGYGFAYIEYEGYFKKGKYDGKGMAVTNTNIRQNIPICNELESYVIALNHEGAIENLAGLEEWKKTQYESLLKIQDIRATQVKGKNVLCSPILTFSTPYDYYFGEFKKGEERGQGLEFKDGVKLYEGNYGGGIFNYHGKGKLYYTSGQLKYEGGFKEGEYHGKGTLYNPDGSVKIKATWKNGKEK